MKRLFLFLVPVCFALVSQAQLPPSLDKADPDGALAAFAAIPRKYQDGIMKISADNAKGNPQQWYIVAHDAKDTPKNFVVADGQLVQNSSGLAQNLRSIFTGGRPITVSKVKIDSLDAWQAAQKYASSKGSKLGTVSYVLQQKGKNSAPIWSVWAYGRDGGYIGMIQLLATSGEVIASE